MQTVAHPELDLVSALADGELPAEETDRLQQHVAGCESCQRELDDAIQLKLLQVPAPRAAQIVKLRKVSEQRRPASVSSGAFRATLAIAACALLALSVALFRSQREVRIASRDLEVARATASEGSRQLAQDEKAMQAERAVRAGLEEELARLQQPQAGLPVLALKRVRGAGAGATLRLASSGWFVLSVEREDPARFDRYRATVLAADGRILWQGNDVHPSSREHLALAFPSSLLPKGEYQLRVEGLGRSGPPQPVAQHSFRIVFER